MNTIHIFIASSEELELERKEIASILLTLNYPLNKQGINLQAVKWEYLDASMASEHQQEEYLRELRKCESCLVIYWRRFGMYTEMEFKTAYTELCAGRNPQTMRVIFKQADPSDIEPDLRRFRESFSSSYSVPSGVFRNEDELRVQILTLLFDTLGETLRQTGLFEIRDSNITCDGRPFINLDNIDLEIMDLTSNLKP